MINTAFNLQDIINLLPPLDGYELKQYVDGLQAEITRLQDVIETQNMEGEFMPTSTDCAFCGVNIATTHTTCDDYVCASCYQEFEDAMNSGATE